VNFTVRKQAVGIYSGTYKDMHQSKGNMIAEVFDCVKIGMDIVCIFSGARTMECREKHARLGAQLIMKSLKSQEGRTPFLFTSLPCCLLLKLIPL
jgi:hypothetical protein